MQSPDNHFEIGVLGSNGLLGSDLAIFLGKKFKIDPITRENYEKKKGSNYKVLINANGNSKRFWANKNPQDDFFASTASVYNSIFDFQSELYIYISSPDVYENHSRPQYTKENQDIDPKKLSVYGFHKYLGELIVKKHKKKYIILRTAMVLGTKLNKGPFYDISHGHPLFISLKSRLQLITTHAIADIIITILKKSKTADIINVGGEGSFSFANTSKYFKKHVQISPGAETQVYELNVKKIKHLYPQLKTSEEYLQEFLSNY